MTARQKEMKARQKEVTEEQAGLKIRIDNLVEEIKASENSKEIPHMNLQLKHMRNYHTALDGRIANFTTKPVAAKRTAPKKEVAK